MLLLMVVAAVNWILLMMITAGTQLRKEEGYDGCIEAQLLEVKRDAVKAVTVAVVL